MNKKIKFVIVGSGNIANTYVSAIQNIDNADIVAVVSKRLKSPSKQKDLPTFTSLKDITIDFNAVIICTPPGLHHVSAIEAATLNKHVFCEKPLDVTLKAMDDMISICKNNNVLLGVAYQRRYSSDNPVIKKLIQENKLGKIFSVDLSVKNYRDDNYYNSASYRGTKDIDGGGPFVQQASHYIDLYNWYFGKPCKIVSKLNTFAHDIEVEDHGVAICVHDSGMINTITASTVCKPGFPAKMEIYSSKGYLIMENDVITHWDMEDLENPTTQSKTSNTHTGAATAMVEDTTNHEFLINDFVNSIIKGKEPLINGEDAKKASEIILEIYSNQF
ncbi:Gfo/Idh/MocA family oxidoreductase [Seonamhaeicola sediminis]|uniref:Gfo/Idh/MocA family oxidoreductase n=1 Tax=Seonamhaeicola sediminis TaxID=2528206 RepID=A0A562YF69_9FLAO|nr:Gfo/Idh/MocA family oxidoreductase [Seonamhaeicola sediminis]TWO33299.1 Gfo/Idh/MocA family oxidoreductase [Seonamhaeicola sediminis]